MGYKLAIVPGLLLQFVIGTCEAQLAELKLTRRHPVPPGNMSLRGMFERFGAGEWDARRRLFRAAPTRDAAQ
jgi:hypothetical protein